MPRAAVSLTPDYTAAHTLLGSAYYNAGILDRAEAAYKKALELLPESGELHNNLAMILYRKGELELARKHILQAKQLGVVDTQLYQLLMGTRR